jgi:hypothetical protein
MGDKFDTNELLQEYEKRAEELNDEDYKKVEATGVDVKDIQNTPNGVPGFLVESHTQPPYYR